jgi:hypothetical protein
MSEATRAVALAHAAQIHAGSGDASAVVETAEALHAFLISDNGVTKAAAPTKASTPKAAPPAKAPAKAPAKKVAPPPEDDADDETEEAEAEATDDDITQEEVGESLSQLITSNRAAAVAILKKYKAKSLSSIAEDDYAAIKQDLDDALMAG